MKINRTFSIPVSTAMKLKTVRNQSALVGRAIEKYLADREDFSIADLPIRQVMASLSARKDCPDGLNALLQVELTRELPGKKEPGKRPGPPFRSLT